MKVDNKHNKIKEHMKKSELKQLILEVSQKLNEASDKTFTIIKNRNGRDSSMTGTLSKLINDYGYTLEKGASWQNEKGNHKINKKPKNIKALIANLNWATNNAAANGYSGTTYKINENIMKRSELKAIIQEVKENMVTEETSLLPPDGKSMKVKDIKSWLNLVFKASKVDYKIVGQTIVLSDDIHTIQLSIYGGVIED